MITRRQISQAYSLISPHLRRTPIIDVAELAGLPLTLKLETLQYTGSFKPRGAFANLLSSEIPPSGVLPLPAAITGLPWPMPPRNFASKPAFSCRCRRRRRKSR